jgi:general secretion pathway protein D
MKALILLSAMAFLAIPSLTLAAEQGEATPDAAASPDLHPFDIQEIIAFVSQRTHKKFVLAGGVHAAVPLFGINPRDVTYALLQTILAAHGFMTYDREGVVVVAPDTNERQIARSPGLSDVAHAADDEVVTTVVEVKNTAAPMLVPVLRALMPQMAHLTSISDHNALLIVDRAANVRRLIGLINEIDKLPVTKSQ